LLIENREAVNHMFGVLKFNAKVSHACMHHWMLTFEVGEQQFESVPFNQDCERFRYSDVEVQRLIAAYIERISKRPTQYHLRESSPIRQGGAAFQNEKFIRSATVDVVLSRTFRAEDVSTYPGDVSFCEHSAPSEYVINVVADQEISQELEESLRLLVPQAIRISANRSLADYDSAAKTNLRCPFFADAVQ
jgi:hypothetical protein